MFRVNCVFVVTCIWIIFVDRIGSSNHSKSQCTTPKNNVGVCAPVAACPEMLNFLQKQPLTQDDIIYFRKSVCTTSSTEPTICCSTLVNDTKNEQQPGHNIFPNETQCGLPIWGRDKLTDLNNGNTSLGMFPWLALLGFRDTNNHTEFVCEGSLISSRYVLTASHCLQKLKLKRTGSKGFFVRLGEFDLGTDVDCEQNELWEKVCAPPPQDINVEEMIVHEDYKKHNQSDNDIGLIRLKSIVAFGPSVSPICLPQKDTFTKKGKRRDIFYSGWGRLEGHNKNEHVIPQVAPLTLDSYECNSWYHKQLEFKTFCASGAGSKKMFCNGHGGGGVMTPVVQPTVLDGAVRIFQLGLESITPTQCDTDTQAFVYTNVSTYMPWIVQHVHV